MNMTNKDLIPDPRISTPDSLTLSGWRTDLGKFTLEHQTGVEEFDRSLIPDKKGKLAPNPYLKDK